jgi:hypothetical protein
VRRGRGGDVPPPADGRGAAAALGPAQPGLRAQPLQGRGAGGAREEEAGQHLVPAQPGPETGDRPAPPRGPQPQARGPLGAFPVGRSPQLLQRRGSPPNRSPSTPQKEGGGPASGRRRRPSSGLHPARHPVVTLHAPERAHRASATRPAHAATHVPDARIPILRERCFSAVRHHDPHRCSLHDPPGPQHHRRPLRRVRKLHRLRPQRRPRDRGVDVQSRQPARSPHHVRRRGVLPHRHGRARVVQQRHALDPDRERRLRRLLPCRRRSQFPIQSADVRHRYLRHLDGPWHGLRSILRLPAAVPARPESGPPRQLTNPCCPLLLLFILVQSQHIHTGYVNSYESAATLLNMLVYYLVTGPPFLDQIAVLVFRLAFQK